jgi:uncharacterized membrane protein
VKTLGALLGLVYPFVVFLGLQWLKPRTLALVVGLLFIARIMGRVRRAAGRHLSPLAGATALLAGFVGLAAWFDDGRYFKLLPVAVNAGLFMVFARTLRGGPSMVETLARVRHVNVPAEHLPYCHRVTVIWSAFFGLNALVILWLAMAASLTAWTLYTGLIAYLLAAALFAGEAVYRARRFGHRDEGLAGALVRWVRPRGPRA